MFLDSFSGAIADLRKPERNQQSALRVLSKHPRVSTWDMAEYAWVRSLIGDLLRDGLITEDRSEPYPWHRYRLTCAGRRAMEADT